MSTAEALLPGRAPLDQVAANAAYELTRNVSIYLSVVGGCNANLCDRVTLHQRGGRA